MADKNFSLDDILNEYPSENSSGGGNSLDDILNEYPATKLYEESGFSDIFGERDSTTSIDLSGINISLQSDYPDAEEIRRRNREAEEAQRMAEQKIADEERIKKSKQIDYEIMSGDYERKYMPDELKTSEDLKAEREAKKKLKVKPSKRKFDDAPLEGIKSVGSFDDDMEKKYGNAPLFTSEERGELLQEFVIPYEIEEPAGRSFSEKVEMAEEYEQKYSAQDESRRQAHAEKQEKHKDSVKVKPERRKKDDNPLSKYSALDSTINEQENELDSILSRYDSKEDDIREEVKESVKAETSPLKSFTDVLNKLYPKGSGDDSRSELLEAAKKPAPRERKQISDIPLNIEGKVIPDTSQINSEKARAELEKMTELKERRNEKSKNFVLQLEGDDEEKGEGFSEDETAGFENMDDPQSIAAHIDSQKGKLIARLFLLIILFAFATYIAIANDFTLPVLEKITQINKKLSPDTFLFVNSIIGVAAGVVAYQTVANGISRIFSMKSDCDTLPALALVSSLVTSMVSLINLNMVRGSLVCIFIPVAIGSLIFNTVGKLLIISRTQRSFADITDDNEHYGLFIVENEADAQNFTNGALTDVPVLAGMHRTDTFSGFLKTSYSSDSADKFCRIAAPVVAAAGILAAVVAGLMARTEHGSTGAFCIGLSTFSACAAICSCFSMMLVVNLPVEIASRAYSRRHGAFIGFDSIDTFSETNSMLTDAQQLFPNGSIKLVNIKTFQDTVVDEAIIEAASLTNQSGSILTNMFNDIICWKTEILHPVESYLYEDSMGLCGWINNKRVLLGNRELMINHSIEGLPSVEKESEYIRNDNMFPVYLSISGQLSAAFVIELRAEKKTAAALKELEKQHISVMVRSVDSMLSVATLARIFRVSPAVFRLIPFRLHPDFERTTEFKAKCSASLGCSGKFPAYAQLIMGASRLRNTVSMGIALHAAELLLGILLVLTLVLLRSMGELTVTNILLYNLFFVAAYIVAQIFRRV